MVELGPISIFFYMVSELEPFLFYLLLATKDEARLSLPFPKITPTQNHNILWIIEKSPVSYMVQL